MTTDRVCDGAVAGLGGWIAAEHGRTYAAYGFGRDFESAVAQGVTDFLQRLAPPARQVFWARDETGFVAALSLDGPDDAVASGARLQIRWVIVAERARGRGLGRALLERAIVSARAAGASGLFLETFRGLDAARALYERAGFQLVSEAETRAYGPPVLGQRFELDFI